MLKPPETQTTTQLAVLQATPFCNINCSYCYLPDRSSTKRMQLSTLARIFESLFSSPFLSDRISIVWHAGEPLVLPIAFYEQAFQLAEQYNTRNIRITHCFQTNGTLITQAWCDFINKHHVRIGLSLDGPEPLHNAHRLDRAGRGTFARVMRGLALLQQNNIHPSTIMVLTRDALAQPDAIWHFFRTHNLTNIGFNIEEIEGVHTTSSLSSQDILPQYKRFWRRFLELRDSCDNPPFVRELDTIIHRLKSTDAFTSPLRSQENTPMSILNFDHHGNISTYSPELLTMTDPHYGDFILANVFDKPLSALPTTQKLITLDTNIRAGVTMCQQTCQYFSLCGGGAPSNKLAENGMFDCTETMRCRLSKQALIDVVLEYLEEKYDLPCEPDANLRERVGRVRGRMYSLVNMSVNNPDFDNWSDWGNSGR